MRQILIYIFVLLLGLQSATAQNKYILECNGKILEASRDSALSQVGIFEKTGKNDGKNIEKYLASVGLPKGSAYCAAGQYWCFYSAAKDLNLNVNNIPIKRTGLANEMFTDAIDKGKKVKYMVNENDMIVWRKSKSWQGHIERVIGVIKAGWVCTVGFNTTCGKLGNQRNGGGVFIRKRNIYYPIGRMVVLGLIGFKLTNSL